MVKVCFITVEGERVETDGAEGDSLLVAGQAIGMPLEGTCEGQMACSTCHVVVDKDWYGLLPAASEEEEDMLDLAAAVERTSRLSCQVLLTSDLDGLTVRIPKDSHDAQAF